MKKKIALLALISVFGISKAANGNYSELSRYGAGLLALGASKYILDEVGKTQALKNGCDSANISSTDLANVGGLAVGIATLGFMTSNPDEKSVLYTKSLSVPLAASVLWLASTKAFRGIAQKIPVIGEYFVCPNEECNDTCKDCKLTKGLLGLGSYVIIKDLIKNKIF